MTKQQWIKSQSEAPRITNPNWQPTIKVLMYVAAGFDSLTLQEVIASV